MKEESARTAKEGTGDDPAGGVTAEAPGHGVPDTGSLGLETGLLRPSTDFLYPILSRKRHDNGLRHC